MPNKFYPAHWDGPYINKSRVFDSACATKFGIALNGYKGGDGGHGARLLLSICDQGGTDFAFRQRDGLLQILFSGDAEIENAALGLRFAAYHANRHLGLSA